MEALALEEETGAELGPMSITPHNYQWDGFGKTMTALEREGLRSALVVMPTGTGKTVLMMMLARQVIEDGGRVLITAHTGELIEQAVNSAAMMGIKATVERAGEHARPDFTASRGQSSFFGDPKLVIATVQTLQGRRLAAWPSGHFDLIIPDKAHHSAAPTHLNIYDHFQPKWLVGFTATADRGDGKPICGQNQVFERCTYEYFMHDAVRNGFLKRPVAKVLDTTIDLSALRVKGASDLNEKEIEELLLPHVSEICNELKGKLEGHRAVIFTPMVASADAVASALCSLGVSAVSVSGQDDPKTRKSIFTDFRQGRYRHLVNAMLCTEGWDEPSVDSSVILWATRSRALYCQMAGRCLRRYAGKPEGYIWGLNWKTHGHDLVHPVQIFDSPTLQINRETIAGAQKLVDSGEELDLAAALKRAQSERKERKRIALKVHSQRAKAVEYTYDPLGVRAEDMRPVKDAGQQSFTVGATDPQIERLVKLGIDRASAMGWSKARASGFIGKQSERRDQGLCTYKQEKLLRSLGHPDATHVPFAQASAEIDRMKSGLSPSPSAANEPIGTF